MKKIMLFVLLAAMSVQHSQAQLLYKITGKDLQKPSYIIGSHHLANVGFINKIAGVKQALSETQQVFGELDMTEMDNPANKTKLEEAMKLPEGKTLMGLLTPDQQKRLNAKLKELLGADMTNQKVANKMNHMTPQALYTTMALSIYLNNHMGEYDPTASFDKHFQAQAKVNSKPIGGLETVDFQAKVLLNGKSIERQIALLMCLVDHTDMIERMQEQVTKAFYDQDLDAVKAAMDEKMNNSCDSTPEEEAQLVDNRNQDWVNKMPAIMAATPTFFVVGAAHLPGDKGVLNLLRQAGYTVEGVK